MKKFILFLIFLAATAALLILGGLLIDHSLGYPVAFQLNVRWFLFVTTITIALIGSTAFFIADRKTFVFAGLLYVSMTLLTLYTANAAASLILPGWPINALHGAKPNSYWRDKGDSFSHFNSWGQRDLERTQMPDPQSIRIAFIGDSFLEESDQPVSLVVENALSQSFEILNLGISVSSPDEYFYRIKNVALPLSAEGVFLFYYAGNDGITSDTLKSYWGIAAVAPRDSLLSYLHLNALNYALTNHQRPFFQSWGQAAEVVAMEQKQVESLSKATDQELIDIFLKRVEEPYRPKLKAVLIQPEAKRFFDAVRNPDEKLFRSYLIDDALKLAAGQRGLHQQLDESFAYGWIKKSHELCARNNIRFTLVMIPEAFQVDPRMRNQFAPICDMKQLYAGRQKMADLIRDRALKDGLDVLDLADVLSEQPGTYLNLDGHWSKKGLYIVSTALTQKIRQQYQMPSK